MKFSLGQKSMGGGIIFADHIGAKLEEHSKYGRFCQ